MGTLRNASTAPSSRFATPAYRRASHAPFPDLSASRQRPERWSPEFGQYVKLDPNLTQKDLSHGYPT